MTTVLVGLAVALLVGGFWLKDHDRQVRETEAAVRSRDSLALAIADERAERAGQHTRDSIESARKVAQRDAELRYARLRTDSLRVVAGNLRDSLEAVTPDSLSPLVQRIVAAWRAEQDAWLQERSTADSALATRDARIVALEATYAVAVSTFSSHVDECMAQLDRALKRASPSILTRVIRALPWLGGAAATGYAVGHLSR